MMPWREFYQPGVPHSLEYPERNGFWILEHGSSLSPRGVALRFYGRSTHYDELREASLRLAGGLKGLGIKEGERVALLLPNSPPYPISYFATLALGAVVVQLNPLYTAHEVESLLEDSGSNTVITLSPLLEKVAPALKKGILKRVILAPLQDYLPAGLGILFRLKCLKERGRYKELREKLLSFRGLMERPPIPPNEEIDPRSHPAVLQYTSGTTGTPKAVILTHYNIVANAMQLRAWGPQIEDGKEVILCVIPFFHAYGMSAAMNAGLYMGARLVLMPRFDPQKAIETIRREGVTMLPGIPTLYSALITAAKERQVRLPTVRTCISGGATLPEEVAVGMEEMIGGMVVEGYGLSEASPVTHANPLNEGRRFGSIGIPLPDTEARIVDPATGEPLPPNRIGELVVKGPQVMKGYWKREEETRETLRDGWLYTGDLARMDEEGFFYLDERKKDIIISGGYNISPREVEDVLLRHPDVLEAAVVGVENPEKGEVPQAHLVTRQEVSQDEIVQFCRKRLAPFKVPKSVVFHRELPKNMLGKVLKKELKAQKRTR